MKTSLVLTLKENEGLVGERKSISFKHLFSILRSFYLKVSIYHLN